MVEFAPNRVSLSHQPSIVALDLNWLTDRGQAPIAAAVLTFIAMGVLAIASIRLKQWICNKDPHMKRSKPLVEELYGIATGIVALCFVTAVQFLLLGEVVANRPGRIEVYTDKLPLVGKLAILSVVSLGVMVILASARTRLARLEITLAKDASGEPIALDLQTELPRTKKVLILAATLVFLLGECYVVADVFSSNVQLLRY